MYNDLIILTQLIQHSSGSSPHHHLHTSCFHSIWLICFPTSFYVSLSLLSCCARPPLYYFPASHPTSLCHLFAFKLLSLQPPWWFSISLYFLCVKETKMCCSVSKSCLTHCDPVDCSMPDFPVHHCLPEFAQVHVYCISEVIHAIMPWWCHSSDVLFFCPQSFPAS